MDANTTKGNGLAASRHATPESEAPPASSSANTSAPVDPQNALKSKGNGLQLSKHASPSPEPETPAGKEGTPPVQKRGRGNAKYNQNAGTTMLEREFKFEALPDNQVKVDRFLEAVKEHFPYPSRRGGRGGGVMVVEVTEVAEVAEVPEVVEVSQNQNKIGKGPAAQRAYQKILHTGPRYDTPHKISRRLDKVLPLQTLCLQTAMPSVSEH
jgi:hypothetical protein